jgi:hypothetical protein
MALDTTPGGQNSDSYVTVEEAAEYAASRGLAFPPSPTDAAEQALRRATAWIDNTYRSRFPGEATDVWQALEFPRCGAIYRGQPYDEDTIPPQIKSATIEAAIREMESPGSLSPDLERGGAVKSLKAGSVEIEYADNADLKTTFTAIDGLLSPFLKPVSNTKFVARA